MNPSQLCKYLKCGRVHRSYINRGLAAWNSYQYCNGWSKKTPVFVTPAPPLSKIDRHHPDEGLVMIFHDICPFQTLKTLARYFLIVNPFQPKSCIEKWANNPQYSDPSLETFHLYMFTKQRIILRFMQLVKSTNPRHSQWMIVCHAPLTL